MAPTNLAPQQQTENQTNSNTHSRPHFHFCGHKATAHGSFNHSPTHPTTMAIDLNEAPGEEGEQLADLNKPPATSEDIHHPVQTIGVNHVPSLFKATGQ